jgi:hypothetical protein
MPLIEDDLWGEVLGSAAEGVGTGLDDLGEAEVRKLEVTVLGKQEVLRLEVAENDVLVMEVFKDENYLGCVETV